MKDSSEIGLISMRDLAAHVGCSHVSVSRALRNEKSVSKQLRDKVLAAVEELGYRPNPMVASLMSAQSRKRGRTVLRANVGWLTTHPVKDFWHLHSYKNIYMQGAAERASQLGYGFDEVWALEENMTGKRLMDIFEARGIQGVVVSGGIRDLEPLNLDWSSLTAVCLGDYRRGQKEWHRAGASARLAVQNAFSNLRKLGYARIGLVLAINSLDPSSFDDYLKAFNRGLARSSELIQPAENKARLAAFYYAQSFVDSEECLRPFFYDRTRKDFYGPAARYLARIKPDAIIVNDRAILEIAKEAQLRVPEDIAVAHLDLGEDVIGWAGINAHKKRISAAAIDLLVGQIQLNERGIPEYQKFTRIEGDWVDGWTAPPLVRKL